MTLLRTQGTKRQAQLRLGRIAARVISRGQGRRVADGRRQVERLAVAPNLDRCFFARSGNADALRQRACIDDRGAVEFQNHIADLDARLGRRAIGNDFGHERTVGRGQFEGVRQRLIQGLHLDAQSRMRDLAGLHDLVLDLHRQVDRNGERDALVSAGVAVNLRIDANDRAGGVKQRTAGIARIDRRIRLDEGHVPVTRQ